MSEWTEERIATEFGYRYCRGAMMDTLLLDDYPRPMAERIVDSFRALAGVPNPEALPKLLEACKRVEGAYEGYGAGNAPGDFWTALEMTCRAYRELMKEADDAPR